MNKNLYPFFPMAIGGLIFLCAATGCDNKDSCSDREDKPLRMGLEASIPYKNGQSLRFKTNEGDTFRVSVSRKFEILKPQSPFVCEEYLELILKDPNKEYPFVESIQRGLATDSMFQMAISPHRKNGTGTIVQFYLKKNQQLAGFSNGNYQSTLLPALDINGKQYSDVLKLDYYNANDDENITQFFYNKQFGILQCRTKGGFIVTRVD